MKTKLNDIFYFYKLSVKDIFGFVKYMSKKFLRYHMVITFVVILVWCAKQYLDSNDFEKLTGVLISIIAAILFEGYRGYRKDVENKKIVAFCLNDLVNTLSREIFILNNLKGLMIRLVVDYKYNNILYGDKKIVNVKERDVRKILELLIRDITLFDKLKIYPEFRIVNGKEVYEKYLNDHYEIGLEFYESLKVSCANKIYWVAKETYNTVTTYENDPVLLEQLLTFKNLVKNFGDDELKPDIYRKGTFCATYGEVLKVLINMLLMIKLRDKYLDSIK